MKRKKVAPDPDETLKRVLVFVDRHGVVEAKSSSPMHSSLTMWFKEGPVSVQMHAHAAAQGNGSCGAVVRYRKKIVFKAAGCYTAGPFNTEIETYVPGAWEKTIFGEDKPAW